jgi:hypothetical protein
MQAVSPMVRLALLIPAHAAQEFAQAAAATASVDILKDQQPIPALH